MCFSPLFFNLAYLVLLLVVRTQVTRQPKRQVTLVSAARVIQHQTVIWLLHEFHLLLQFTHLLRNHMQLNRFKPVKKVLCIRQSVYNISNKNENQKQCTALKLQHFWLEVANDITIIICSLQSQCFLLQQTDFLYLSFPVCVYFKGICSSGVLTI